MLDIREIFGIGLFALLLLAAVTPAGAEPARHLTGPVAASVERVVDGDTLEVRAQIWLGQEVRVLVRLDGVDKPELHGTCAQERELAAKTRAFVQEFIAQGGITLREINQDKYGDRVVAQVLDAHSRDLLAALIAARATAGLTQTELASRMGTTQAVIARLEGGKTRPSTQTLARFAAATGYRLKISLEPLRPAYAGAKPRLRAGRRRSAA